MSPALPKSPALPNWYDPYMFGYLFVDLPAPDEYFKPVVRPLFGAETDHSDDGDDDGGDDVGETMAAPRTVPEILSVLRTASVTHGDLTDLHFVFGADGHDWVLGYTPMSPEECAAYDAQRAAPRATLPTATMVDVDQLQAVTFHWSLRFGECYDCGSPAAYRSGAARICSVCAADRAADGEPIRRLSDHDLSQ